MKKILLYSVYHQITSLKKESFTVFSGWNETDKLPAYSLEITVCLFWQQGIRKRIGNKGGEDVYLTKRFIWKQVEYFYQTITMELLSNF